MSGNLLADIGISAIQNVANNLASARSDSLIEYTRAARVEPIVLIDADALFSESTHDVLQALNSIFAGYYLQAVALSSNVGRVSVMKTLDKLNPNRDPLDAAAGFVGSELGTSLIGAGMGMLSQESYKHRLPTFESMALEADLIEASVPRDSVNVTKELANLSVGKIFNVEITDNGHKASIPVSIRLIATSIPTQNLIHILSAGSKDVSMKERWHAWKSGRLSFVRDLILCQDLIDAHKKALMNDKDGVFQNIINRKRNNQLSTILSGNISVATASNMVVTTKNTIAQLEIDINGRFKDFNTRQKIFKETSLMIIAVIDPSWDRVTFYHRGIPEITELSVRDLKSSNKSGPDVMEIMKAYVAGSGPTL